MSGKQSSLKLEVRLPGPGWPNHRLAGGDYLDGFVVIATPETFRREARIAEFCRAAEKEQSARGFTPSRQDAKEK